MMKTPAAIGSVLILLTGASLAHHSHEAVRPVFDERLREELLMEWEKAHAGNDDSAPFPRLADAGVGAAVCGLAMICAFAAMARHRRDAGEGGYSKQPVTA